MRSDVLLVQPDPEQSVMIRAVLEANGFSVAEAPSLDALGTTAQSAPPSAVLVHWSGSVAASKVLDTIVRRNGHYGCAIVTARDSELSEALSALEIGYDDCLRIPVSATELLARLNASLKRRRGHDNDQLRCGPLKIDKKAFCLYIDGEPVRLAPTEYRLLNFFLENPGRVFSREEILHGAWPKNISAGSRTVDVHVRRLRQVLEPYGCEEMIQTVRSFGYRFREPASAD